LLFLLQQNHIRMRCHFLFLKHKEEGNDSYYHRLFCYNRTKEEGDDSSCRHLLHRNRTKEEDNGSLLLSPTSL